MGTETNKFGQEPTSLDKDQHVWNTGNGVRGREGCQREGRGGAKPTTNQRSTTTLRNNQSECDYNITSQLIRERQQNYVIANQRVTTTLRNHHNTHSLHVGVKGQIGMIGPPSCEYRALWELCDSIYLYRCSKMNTTDL
ncbi:unnamed protein product [Timema podura]|uniref:Uncharacterized protein n=1 Tax=Timema podura TaxID=61482 RepID=A0ABN7NW46_TIMPD|nr:unnamed protein product [Timema podura]